MGAIRLGPVPRIRLRLMPSNVVHRTNEHGYFYNKAKVYKRPDIAKLIVDEPNQYKLKDYFTGLGDNAEWKKLQAPTLRRLFRKKMEQHPHLEEQLLKTAPYRLIEASVDPRWGGGGGENPSTRLNTTMERSEDKMSLGTLQQNTGIKSWVN